MAKYSNALDHGVYSKVKIMRGERPEDFDALLARTRQGLGLQKTEEEESVFEIALLYWYKWRLTRSAQSAYAALARAVRKSGKKSGKRKKPRNVNYTNAVAQLSETIASFAGALNKVSAGKLGEHSMIRSMVSDIEKLQPIIAAAAKSFDSAETIDRALKRLKYYIELDSRLNGQIVKQIQILTMRAQFKRQYGKDSNVKVFSHDPPTGQETKASVTQLAAKASSKNQTDTNDDWADDNDNDNDNDYGDDNDIDHNNDDDDALAEQKKAHR